MDCSPPSSSLHGILKARILKWVAMPFPTQGLNPCLLYCRRILYLLSIREAPGWPSLAIAVQQPIVYNVECLLLFPSYFCLPMNYLVSPMYCVLKSMCLCLCCSLCLKWLLPLVCSVSPFKGPFSEKLLQAELHTHLLRLSLLLYFPHGTNQNVWWLLDHSLIPLLEWKLWRPGNVHC